jgi:hypothetical protein
MTQHVLHKLITDVNLVFQSISYKYKVFNKSTPLMITTLKEIL